MSRRTPPKQPPQPKRTEGQRFEAGSVQTYFYLDAKELDAAVERLVAAYDKFKTGRQS